MNWPAYLSRNMIMSPYEELKKENERLRKLLLIKESDLDKLEEARVRLYKMFPDPEYNNYDIYIRLQNITGIMWIIANSKKYRTGYIDNV